MSTNTLALWAILLTPLFSSTVFEPPASDKPVLNKGMGWVLYDPAPDEKSPEALALASTAYARFSWADIEPEEGQFNWQPIDDAIDAWGMAGKQFAFGVIPASSESQTTYVTPKWVFDAGASSITINRKGRPDLVVPNNWDDPVYLQKLADFLTAMAKRYDNNPAIAFIDIRSYGNYGEGHIKGLGGVELSDEGYIKHVQLHLNVFHKTQLILPYGFQAEIHEPVFQWAVDHGVGLRRDGILGGSDGSELQLCKDCVPAVMEWHGPYKEEAMTPSSSAYLGDKFDERLLSDTETARGTYQNLGQWGLDSDLFVSQKPEVIKQLTNRLGFHFILRRMEVNVSANGASSMEVRMDWENTGLASLFFPAKLQYALIDEDGTILQNLTSALSIPNSLRPGQVSTFNESLNWSPWNNKRVRIAVGMTTEKWGKEEFINLGNDGQYIGGYLVLGTVRP